MYVQASDDIHFNGRQFSGKLKLRDRIPPPEWLIPVHTAAVQYICQLVRAEHEATESEIKALLST